MGEGYKIVYEGGSGEIEEKKSRFIATVRPVESEEEVTAFLAEMKKKYWDARHNCFAYVIGEKNELVRCSDDGEPSGTAGRPMLDVLLREEIHNGAVVVTRYFGGTLLGTRGLVRAYQQATKEGLSNSQIVEKRKGCRLLIDTDYNGIGKIQYLFGQEDISILDTVYAEAVQITAMIPAEKKEKIGKALMEGTNGKARLSWGDEVEYVFVEKKLKIF